MMKSIRRFDQLNLWGRNKWATSLLVFLLIIGLASSWMYLIPMLIQMVLASVSYCAIIILHQTMISKLLPMIFPSPNVVSAVHSMEIHIVFTYLSVRKALSERQISRNLQNGRVFFPSHPLLQIILPGYHVKSSKRVEITSTIF
jgi:hypothetical protein